MVESLGLWTDGASSPGKGTQAKDIGFPADKQIGWGLIEGSGHGIKRKSHGESESLGGSHGAATIR